MQVLRLTDLLASKWKNGGGTTRQYAVHPPGAGTDDFFWRVSRARIDHHGTFSVFPGIDRTLAVIEGGNIDLLFPDRRVRLDRSTPPYPFRGDTLVECRVPEGPIEDLNVMTRRGHWVHAVVRHGIAAPTTLALDGDHNLLFVLGATRVGTQGTAAVDLAPGDGLDFDGAATVTVEPIGERAELLVVRLDHVATPRV